jgi:hypothetical protein
VAGPERPAQMGSSVVSRWHRHDVSILPADEAELGRSVLGLTAGREPLDDAETGAAAGTGVWHCASVIGRRGRGI